MNVGSTRVKALLVAFLVIAKPAAAIEVYGAIGEKWRAIGAAGGILGAPVTAEADAGGNGRFQSFQRGHIYWSPATGAHLIYGSIHEKWQSLGGVAGYGFPVTDEMPGARGGRYNDFSKGNSIYWSTPTGARAVYGHIRNKWRAIGGDNSYLRYPNTDELPAANGGRMSGFEGGVIYWHPNAGPHVVVGRILEEWTRLGREAGACGYPTSDEHDFDDGRVDGEYGVGKRYKRSNFQNGYILFSKARNKLMPSCAAVPAPAPAPAPAPPAAEACTVSVTVANRTCSNADGTPSSLQPGGTTATGCGATMANALARAEASFQTQACLTDGDNPAPGCCTYAAQASNGCLCR